MLDSTEPVSNDSDDVPQRRSNSVTDSSRHVAKVKVPKDPVPDPTADLEDVIDMSTYRPNYDLIDDVDVPPDMDFLNPDWEMPAPSTFFQAINENTSDEEPPNEDAGRLNTPLTTPRYADVNTYDLIDYFAAHALNGLLAGKLSVPNTPLDAPEIARLAYDFSEAMLDERANRIRKMMD